MLEPAERDAPPSRFLGHIGFFTDVNGCVSRAAWERVPFRAIAYAEDHLLAQDMLRAGFAKVFVPDAAVIHSHEYTPVQWLRRSFDEARAIREVYEWAPGPRTLARDLRGGVIGDWRALRAGARGAGGPASAGAREARSRRDQLAAVSASVAHHGSRCAGALLGGHAAALPSPLAARLSLEGRG